MSTTASSFSTFHRESSAIKQQKTIVLPSCKGGHDYLPITGDCKSYVRCDNGLKYISSCGEGTTFDTYLKICVWPSVADRPECHTGKKLYI